MIELDKQVAQALGYEIYMEDNHGIWVYFPFEQSDPTLFCPSQNKQDAWLLIHELQNNNQAMSMEHILKDNVIAGFNVGFFDYKHTGKSIRVSDERFEIAVCKAGLEMLEYLRSL